MDKIEQLKQQKQYEAYVKKKTPQHNVWFNMMKAFFLGGTICLIGQCIYHFCELKKLSPDDCSSWTSILLILLSILLTGTGIYPLLAKWGGAGALVPITGFANSVAAPAIEYKKADEILVTSSSKLCMHCNTLDGQPVGGKAPEMLEDLRSHLYEEFEEATN